MSLDCQWVEKNLEALFCDKLSGEEKRAAQAHIENCSSCRKEVQALNAIDPLIKSHFRREMAIARTTRVLHKGRVAGLSGAAAAVLVASLVLLVRTPQSIPVAAPVSVPPVAAPVASVNTPAPIKENATAEPVRQLKPEPAPNAPTEAKSPSRTPAVTPNAPDFAVSDPAGYSHTLDQYRGHVLVIGVWSPDQSEAIANIERLYKTYSANPKFRFLGVASERQSKPANTTFPVAYNQGSKLFGARAGDFVVLNESGTIELRGSLVNDFENLRRVLQTKN